MTGPMSLLAEPPKSGVKEKRRKAASFQTVSQLHKVKPSLGLVQALTLPPPPRPGSLLCPLHPGRAAVKTCSDV